MKAIKLVIVLMMGFVLNTNAQKAIKLEKQQTKFFYTQVNLHGGLLNDSDGERWGISNRSPKNQVAFQFYAKNKKSLQRGYVKWLRPSAVKVKMSVFYDYAYNPELQKWEGDIKLKLLDTWLKFNTKWDRTSITIGKKGLPYGHNPKLDPVSSFMTNVISTDIGFSQDIGVFFKTPIAKNLDLDLAITSGGIFDKPILVCNNIIEDNRLQDEEITFDMIDVEYNGTWLVSGRVGQPSFKKNEVGMLFATGLTHSNFIKNDYLKIAHGGFDWVYKHKEKFKITNQITGGTTDSKLEGQFINFNIQNNIDLYLKKVFVMSLSHSTNYLENWDRYFNDADGKQYVKNTLAGSLTYVVSPHTRIRCNQYYVYNKTTQDGNWGVLFQLVTGFGKRP